MKRMIVGLALIGSVSALSAVPAHADATTVVSFTVQSGPLFPGDGGDLRRPNIPAATQVAVADGVRTVSVF